MRGPARYWRPWVFVNMPCSLEAIRGALNSFVSSAEGPDSVRVFHGRGRCYSGLEHVAVDYFAPTYVVTLFKDCGVAFEHTVIDCIYEVLGESVSLLLQRRFDKHSPFTWVSGRVEALFAQRGDHRFFLNTQSQNIGYFLDIEPARQWLEKNGSGANVLNLFAYTCTFSVVAKHAGAHSVLNMDMSSPSLSVGRRNHQLNGISTTDVKFFANDIFKSWGRLKRFAPYDIAVIDPPSYQKNSFIAERDYAKVLRRVNDMVSSSGYVLACLNSPEISADAFCTLLERELTEFSCEQRLPNSPDFPDEDEQKALKMFVFRKNSGGCSE